MNNLKLTSILLFFLLIISSCSASNYYFEETLPQFTNSSNLNVNFESCFTEKLSTFKCKTLSSSWTNDFKNGETRWRKITPAGYGTFDINLEASKESDFYLYIYSSCNDQSYIYKSNTAGSSTRYVLNVSPGITYYIGVYGYKGAGVYNLRIRTTCNTAQTCNSHSTTQCYNENAYWYNSCGQKEELKQNCNSLGCTNGQCNLPPSTTQKITTTNYTSTMENGYIGAIEWSTQGNIKETGIYFAYKSDKSDAQKISSKINSLGTYAAMISSKKGVCQFYLRPYAITTTGQTIYENWITVTSGINTCSTKSTANLNSENKLVYSKELIYSSTSTCNTSEIPFNIDSINWTEFCLTAGYEAAKLVTIGSCIDDGVLTLGCGFDVFSTVIMIVPMGGTELGAATKAAKTLAILSDGSRALKTIGSVAKLSKVIKTISLTVEGSKIALSGTKIARAVELGLIKVDFVAGKMTTTTTKLVKWFTTKGESAITKLKGTGATNEMLETIITKGSADLDKTINLTSWSKGTAYLGDGISGASGWGWKHMVSQKHNIQIQSALKLVNSDSAVKLILDEVIKTGTLISNTGGKYTIEKIIKKNGVSKNMRVIVSSDTSRVTEGRIITGYLVS